MPSFPLLPLNPPQRPLSRKSGKRAGQQGQSIVLLTLMFIALVAFVGLATDSGILYVTYGQFRRAVDAAALGAASQYRQARPDYEIEANARQFILLQGITPTSFNVEDCYKVSLALGRDLPTEPYDESDPSTANPDPAICDYPVRKLVRVEATTDASLVFMPMFGFFPKVVGLRAEAVAEAASLDVMLVIDISPSMTYDAAVGNPLRIPDDDAGGGCNNIASEASGLTLGVSTGLPDYYPSMSDRYSPIHSCRPFEWVRDAAVQFVDKFVKFPYDRVGIVTFSNSAETIQSVGDSEAISRVATLEKLRDMDVATSSSVPPSIAAGCSFSLPDRGIVGACAATNTGDGLVEAGVDLENHARSNALRFIILLSDGAVNGSSPTAAANLYYACPKNTVTGSADYDQYMKANAAGTRYRVCDDGDARWQTKHLSTDILYDADDYARDMASTVVVNSQTIIFTVGLGAEVTVNPGAADGCPTDTDVSPMDGKPDGLYPDTSFGYGASVAPYPLCNADRLPNGEQLLRYIADMGDGNGVFYTGPGPCGRDNATGLYYTAIGTSCGNYFYAASGSQLLTLFNQIAENIFTRITK